MNYMMVYIDSYDRNQRTRCFNTEQEMHSFASHDEVFNVIAFYKLEKIDV